MTAFPPADPAVGGHGALHLLTDGSANAVTEFPAPASSGPNKRKRRPAGTPDPGAEVVALSPKTLMESDRYVCEICHQGFQRDQNLQMHRRRHKVPWKLLKRANSGGQKRVYVCPERSCLHHDPSHALGDLVGIKKHFRRKHCTEKQWKCEKCSKGYAVQSDFKAHLKTCGTRGHCCDCGRVFSRVESFIEHQDTCSAVKQKNMESEGGSERKSPLQQRTDRNSNESPASQSSDTTQAIPFAHSGMSDTTAKSLDSNRIINEPPRRFESPVGMIPTWLMDRRCELELLPSKQQLQDSYSEALPSSSSMQEIRRDQVSGSRSQVTRCSSMNSACLDASCSDPKSFPLSSDDVNTPYLQLSIGPYSNEVASSSPFRDSPCIDTKPSLISTEREIRTLPHHPMSQTARVSEVSIKENQIREQSNSPLGKDLGLSFPEDIAQPTNIATEDHGKQAISLNDFLIQAARRLGSPRIESQPESSQPHQAKRPSMSMLTEMGRGTSTYHGERVRIQEADSSEMRTTRGGSSQHSQGAPPLEHATSIVSRKHALDQMDDHHAELFAASRSIDEAHRQKEMAAAAFAEASQAREQARTDIDAAWSDLAAARRTKEQARQERSEAQKELARADTLKREAREQLELASAERTYADHAREVAKRQVELAEAELASAKRLREHAQDELEKAHYLKESAERSADAIPQDRLTFCHSCKSTSELFSMTPTPYPSSWPLMAPTPTLIDLQGTSSAGQSFTVSGSSFEGTMSRAVQAIDHTRSFGHHGNRPWSGTSAPPPIPSGDRSGRWPGNRSMPTYAISMAIDNYTSHRNSGEHSESLQALGNQSSSPQEQP